MANLVYNMVCDAFADLISRRAAENLVRDALRDIGSHPDRVTALEMQELLRKGIFKRLQKIIPVVQAKGEIKRLLRKLEKTLAKPIEGMEVLETSPPGDTTDPGDWDEPDTEAVDLSPWEVRTERATEGFLQDLPPVAATGAPLEAAALIPPSEAAALIPPSEAAALIPPSEAAALIPPSEAAVSLPLAVASPAVSVPPVPAPQLALQAVLTLEGMGTAPRILPPDARPETLSEVLPDSRKVGEAAMSTEENVTAPLLTAQAAPPDAAAQAESSEEVLLVEEGDLFGDASDLFEFEETSLESLSGLPLPRLPKPALREVRTQEAVLSRLALESGVMGVMLSTRAGEVLSSRLGTAEGAPQLAAAVAHAAAGAEGGVPPGLFYADLEGRFVLVAPLDDAVLLTVLAASSTNLGRLLTDIVSLKEEL